MDKYSLADLFGLIINNYTAGHFQIKIYEEEPESSVRRKDKILESEIKELDKEKVNKMLTTLFDDLDKMIEIYEMLNTNNIQIELNGEIKKPATSTPGWETDRALLPIDLRQIAHMMGMNIAELFQEPVDKIVPLKEQKPDSTPEPEDMENTLKEWDSLFLDTSKHLIDPSVFSNMLEKNETREPEFDIDNIFDELASSVKTITNTSNLTRVVPVFGNLFNRYIIEYMKINSITSPYDPSRKLTPEERIKEAYRIIKETIKYIQDNQKAFVNELLSTYNSSFAVENFVNIWKMSVKCRGLKMFYSRILDQAKEERDDGKIYYDFTKVKSDEYKCFNNGVDNKGNLSIIFLCDENLGGYYLSLEFIISPNGSVSQRSTRILPRNHRDRLVNNGQLLTAAGYVEGNVVPIKSENPEELTSTNEHKRIDVAVRFVEKGKKKEHNYNTNKDEIKNIVEPVKKFDVIEAEDKEIIGYRNAAIYNNGERPHNYDPLAMEEALKKADDRVRVLQARAANEPNRVLKNKKNEYYKHVKEVVEEIKVLRPFISLIDEFRNKYKISDLKKVINVESLKSYNEKTQELINMSLRLIDSMDASVFELIGKYNYDLDQLEFDVEDIGDVIQDEIEGKGLPKGSVEEIKISAQELCNRIIDQYQINKELSDLSELSETTEVTPDLIEKIHNIFEEDYASIDTTQIDDNTNNMIEEYIKEEPITQEAAIRINLKCMYIKYYMYETLREVIESSRENINNAIQQYFDSKVNQNDTKEELRKAITESVVKGMLNNLIKIEKITKSYKTLEDYEHQVKDVIKHNRRIG